MCMCMYMYMYGYVHVHVATAIVILYELIAHIILAIVIMWLRTSSTSIIYNISKPYGHLSARKSLDNGNSIFAVQLITTLNSHATHYYI